MTSNANNQLLPFSQSLGHLPFAQLISAARQRQGLSLNAVARGMHAAARQPVGRPTWSSRCARYQVRSRFS
jgi:hypothetical protein